MPPIAMLLELLAMLLELLAIPGMLGGTLLGVLAGGQVVGCCWKVWPPLVVARTLLCWHVLAECLGLAVEACVPGLGARLDREGTPETTFPLVPESM